MRQAGKQYEKNKGAGWCKWIRYSIVSDTSDNKENSPGSGCICQSWH